MNNFIFIFLIIALVVIIISGIFLALFFSHKEKHSKNSNTNQSNSLINNIEDFISKANTAKNSQEIQNLILQFLNSQKISNNPKDNTTKRKLDFVSAISANINATAKNISFLNNELKKRYKSLRKEIDTYEQIGLAKRKMKHS